MREWILYFYYAVAGGVAFFSGLTAFIEQPPAGDPTAGPGFYGALIALCVTSIAVLERLRSSASLRQMLVAAGVGAGLILSAYLWMADEAGAHPSNVEFLAALGLVWGLVAGIVIVFFLIALLTRTPNR